MAHRADLFVGVEMALDFTRQSVERRFADPGDLRSHLGQSTRELALVAREAGFDENDVHRGAAFYAAFYLKTDE